MASSSHFQHQLGAENELRFEVKEGHSAALVLLHGEAEVFGVELVRDVSYTFRGGANVAVFSWHGALLQLEGMGTDIERKAAADAASSVVGTSTAAAASSSRGSRSGGGGAAAAAAQAAAAAAAAEAAAAPGASASTSIAVAYVAEDTPMVTYVNVHAQLEHRRAEASARLAAGNHAIAETAGPRVLICGPQDVGKSSLASVLVSYAVRLGRRPTFVDLDPGQGAISVPGTLSATPCDRASLSVEGGVGGGGTLTSGGGGSGGGGGGGGGRGAAAGPVVGGMEPVPLVYFTGHASAAENVPLQRTLTVRLAAVVRQRDERDADARIGGLVVNTCGWIDGEGLALLHHAIAELAIDTVLVLGSDRLHAVLNAAYGAGSGSAGGRPVAAVTVLKVPRSEGSVIRERGARARARSARLRQYFYGTPQLAPTAHAATALTPQPMLLKFAEAAIFRCGGKAALTTSAMNPMGHSSMLDPHNFSVVGSVAELTQGSVLAVLHPPEGDATAAAAASAAATAAAVTTAAGAEGEAGLAPALPLEHLVLTNVAGFVHVTAIDAEQGTLTLLSPSPGDLPSHYFLVGSVAWLDDQ